MNELNDPMRVFESDPRKGIELLLEKQVKLMREVVTTQDQLADMLGSRSLLETLPQSLRSDPIELGQSVSAFRSLKITLNGYQQALLALAMLTLTRDGLEKIARLIY